MSYKSTSRDDGQETARDSFLRHLKDMHERYDGLQATSGLATVDMSHIWCGWLLFGFAGGIAVSDREETDDIAVLHADGDGRQMLLCETAYCSSVLRDLCDDLSVATEGKADSSVSVFCEAEEHGDYVVSVTDGRVGISVCLDDEVPACSATRDDGGSYLADLAGALVALREDILSRDGEEQADILGSLALFCEMVTEDADGNMDVEDATEEDVLEILAGLPRQA